MAPTQVLEHMMIEQRNGVVRIRLNRPQLHNAFNQELILELTEAFEKLGKKDDVRLILLSGEGKSFCAGADLNWMGKMKAYSREGNIEDSQRLATLFETINACPKPVVGLVHGAALGGGVGLIACCDYVVAVSDTAFGLTEVRVGLVPATIAPFVIAKIGESNARAWFLTGERFSAEQALRMNLIHEVVSDYGHLEMRVHSLISGFGLAGPKAQEAAKKLIFDVLHMPASQVKSHTSEVIADIRVSPEGQEGIDALLTKRKPKWTQE